MFNIPTYIRKTIERRLLFWTGLRETPQARSPLLWRGRGRLSPLPLGQRKITPVQTHGGPSNLNLLTTKSNANSY